MTALTPPKVIKFSADSPEKKVYGLVEKFKVFIPIQNDRYRLAFSLIKYLKGEGDEPLITVKTNKLKLTGITESELANKIEEELQKIR
jgi:hypothetical protein